MSLQQDLIQLQQRFQQQLLDVKDTAALEQLRIQYLGKKGALQEAMSRLREVPPAEKPQAGGWINECKAAIEEGLATAKEQLASQELEARLAQEWIDVTLPGKAPRQGGYHPLSLALRYVVSVLREMGFTPQLGPEIESEFYNFEALNIPAGHPARDMQDTFYLAPGWVLRTHTSNTQVRVMQKTTPPIRVCCPGRVFRNEDVTARSHVQFHQVEVLYVDRNVSFTDLLSTLELFLARLLRRKIAVRFRPSYFPFTEPSLECDVGCLLCEGAGCRVCKYSGWLEILGAGLVHPKVLEAGGIDPTQYSGYAWGMGLERILMILRGISDIRLLTKNQMAFLQS